MSLRIAVVCANYLRNKNESNNKEKRKKVRKKEINNIYMSNKQHYLKF